MSEATLEDLTKKYQLTKSALVVNRNYQENLSLALHQINLALKKNQRLIDELASRTKPPKWNKKKVKEAGKKMSGMPYFGSDGDNPPSNPETVAKKNRIQQLGVPPTFVFKKWTAKEEESLVGGIRQQNQQILVQKVYQKYQNLPKHSNSQKIIVDQFSEEMANISNMTASELLKSIADIEWETLASTCVPSRDAEACRIHWINQLDSKVNKKEWVKQEELKLLEIASAKKGRDWDSIAGELETNRKAYQCLIRYQRALNKDLLRSEWTKEETRVLEWAVSIYGTKNWQQIANIMNGRTGQQCLHRWRETSNPNIRRGLWLLEEDKRLTLAVKSYGPSQWVKVRRHVPGRTDVQCRERWMNVLNPDLTNCDWSKEEDIKLVQAVEEHGIGKWAKVAKDLYPRTDNQCWRRWKKINPAAMEEYKKILRKRKLLVRNFVGRTSQRSKITAEDLTFVPDTETDELPKKKRKLTYTKPTPKLLLDNGELENTDNENLHLVLPSPLTIKALSKMLIDLNHIKPITRTLSSSDYCETKDFKLLSTWFHSVFILPGIILKNGGFINQEELIEETTTNIETQFNNSFYQNTNMEDEEIVDVFN